MMEFEERFLRRRRPRQLGDLPAYVTQDPRANRQGAGVPTRAEFDTSPDMLYQHDVLEQPKTPGSLPYTANVIATFDSRFINGQDFAKTNYETWSITGAPPASLTLNSDFTMPGGYVGVIRRYRYEMDPPVPVDPDKLILDWRVNGVAQPGTQNLTHGQISGWINTFFLFPASATVRAAFRAPTGIASNPGDTRKIFVEIEGNFIQDTGLDLREEVANPDQSFFGGGKGRDYR